MNKYLTLILLLIMPYASFAQVPITNLVTPVSYFVDHVKQLSLVKNNLNKYKKASVVGVSGMGKTQLSRMYAYENKKQYELVWFIDCNLDINEEFLKLAKAINEQAKTHLVSEDVSSVKKEILSYLSTKDKWLLAFDNLKVKENHKVQEFINWEHNGHIIFGAQDGDLLPNIVKMTAFEKSDAITLANNILENSDLKSAEFLAHEFAGYPILIVQGAQLLKQVPGLEKEEYRKKIQQSTDKIKLNITLAIKELKPSAREILNKIALINNQGFSKDLLKIITDYKDNLDDDIYQLSKFALIDNIDPNETNPIFEMHDVIADKIRAINGDKSNKIYLEIIIINLMNTMPKSVVKGYLFRDSKTVGETLEIITKNAFQYNTSINNLLELNLQLLIQYINTLRLGNASKVITWFIQNDKKGKFKLWLMNNDEKSIYARYLGMIGWYYRRNSNYLGAYEYFKKEQEIFNNVEGYDSAKCNMLFGLALTDISLGRIDDAKVHIQAMEQMFVESKADKSDIATLVNVKSRLYFMIGQYQDALDLNSKTIDTFIESGIQPKDLFFSNLYILRAEILNNLEKYQESYTQSEQLFSMCKASKKR